MVGCKEDPTPGPEPTPGPNPNPNPTELTFDVNIKETTKTRMFFEITPSDVNAPYFTVVYEKSFVDDFSKEEYLVGTIYEEITEEANSMGLKFAEYMEQYTDKGAIDASFSGLMADCEYYLLVFGVDPENEYQLSSEISKTAFTTLPAPQSDATFDVTATVDKNTVEFKVVPSDKDIYWHLISVEKAMVDYYLNPDEYGMTLTEFYQYYVQQEIDSLLQAGYQPEDVINIIFLKGDLTLGARGLKAYTEYAYLIAGFILDEDGTWIATEISMDTYTTTEAMFTGMTLDIQVSDVEKTRAAIKITPSDNNERFLWLVGAYDGKSTAEEMMEKTIAQYGMFMDMMANYTGVQDYTGEGNSPYKYRLDSDNTAYFVLAFGYSGAPTTEAYMKTFKTLPGQEAIDATFSIDVSNITSYGATLNVTASDESVQYIIDVLDPANFNEETLMNEVNLALAEMYQQTVAYDPNTTYAQLMSNYYWRGNQALNVEGMAPNSTVMGYIIALDDKTNTAAKIHVFNPLFTTLSEGNINPTVDVLGVYSGDDENGQLFGDAALTKGMAIGVIKYGAFDGAKSLYISSAEGDYSFEGAYADSELFASMNWSLCDMASPYTFTLLSWGKEYTFLAYALDQNNGAGKIGRAYCRPMADDKGTFEELKGHYDAASNASAFTLPESVVVEDIVVEPIVNFVNNEPVVEKQSVAAPAVEPMLIQLDRIKRFTLRD